MTADEALYARAPGDPRDWLAGLRLAMTINGRDVPAALGAPVIDPCTETPIADAPQADLSHVRQSVAAAVRAFPGWAATP